MAGIIDGRNLEDRSVALLKLEVDVPTLAQFAQELLDRAAGDETLQGHIDDLSTDLSGALATHIGTGISTAHGGQINTEGQVPDSSIAIDKLNFTPALQGDFTTHTGDSSIHHTLGTAGTQAAAGNHSHPAGPGSSLDADTVDGYHGSAFALSGHATYYAA